MWKFFFPVLRRRSQLELSLVWMKIFFSLKTSNLFRQQVVSSGLESILYQYVFECLCVCVCTYIQSFLVLVQIIALKMEVSADMGVEWKSRPWSCKQKLGHGGISVWDFQVATMGICKKFFSSFFPMQRFSLFFPSKLI